MYPVSSLLFLHTVFSAPTHVPVVAPNPSLPTAAGHWGASLQLPTCSPLRGRDQSRQTGQQRKSRLVFPGTRVRTSLWFTFRNGIEGQVCYTCSGLRNARAHARRATLTKARVVLCRQTSPDCNSQILRAHQYGGKTLHQRKDYNSLEAQMVSIHIL